MNHPKRKSLSGQLVIGGLLIAFGVLYLLDNNAIIRMGPFYEFWPLFFVWLGIQDLRSTETKDKKCGIWLIAIFSWLLLSNLSLLDRATFPVFLIAIGGALIGTSMLDYANRNPSLESSNGK